MTQGELDFSPSTQTEAQKRDAILDTLQETRTRLIKEARATARSLAAMKGRVTSVEVLSEMRVLGWGAEIDRVDPRFMGAVFRSGWERIGWECTGSHGRTVAIWRLPTPEPK